MTDSIDALSPEDEALYQAVVRQDDRAIAGIAGLVTSDPPVLWPRITREEFTLHKAAYVAKLGHDDLEGVNRWNEGA